MHKVETTVVPIYFTFFLFIFLGVEISMALNIRKRFESGFYDTLLMNGATRFTYWMTSYIKDVTTYAIFGVIF